MSWNPFRMQKEAVVPPLNWWQNGVSEYTPDIAQLERREYQRVFICDAMMKAHHKHSILGDGVINPNVHAFTQQKFSLIKKNLGKLSTVIPLTTQYGKVPYARVRGELYGIPSRNFLELDKYKLNGVEFQRIRVKLLIPYRKMSRDWWAKDRAIYEAAVQQTPFWDETLDAWMYVGLKDYWEPTMTTTDASATDMRQKTTYRRVDGKFVKVLTNPFFKPVKDFEPKNKKLERYYYYSTYHEFGGS